MDRNRRNNPQDMTITEQLEKIKEDICDNYCITPFRVLNGELSGKAMYEICNNKCPFRRL